MADPYLATLNALNSGPTTQYVTVDHTDYEGMRRANEKAAKAEADLKAAKERSAVEATEAWWAPRMDAAEGQAVQSDLNYRAWRAVAEAVEDGLGLGMFDRPITQPPASLVLRHFQDLVAHRKTAPGMDREVSKQLALVERWRLMGLAMDKRAGALADDRAEGALDYYKLSGQLHNGTSGTNATGDTVHYMENRRKPGLIVGVTQAGMRALHELDKKGLAPPGIWPAIAAMAAKRETLYKEWIDEERDLANTHQRKIDALESDFTVLEARRQALESAQKEQNRRGPGWFGKSAWVEALGKTTDDLAKCKEAIALNRQEIKRLVQERNLAQSRGEWVKKRQAVDMMHTMALADLDDEIAKNPAYMDQFAGPPRAQDKVEGVAPQA